MSFTLIMIVGVHQVIVQGQLATLGEVVEERRKSTPTVKLNYFEMEEAPQDGKPGNFTVKRVHDVRFLPAGAPVEGDGGDGNSAGSQTPAATLLPVNAWNSAWEESGILW